MLSCDSDHQSAAATPPGSYIGLVLDVYLFPGDQRASEITTLEVKYMERIATVFHAISTRGIVRKRAAETGVTARLYEAQLENSQLSRAKLQSALLYGAQLQNANLIEAQLQKSLLRRAQFQNAILIAAQLQNADMHGAQLQNANLSKADMADVRNLTVKQVQDACTDGSTWFPVELMADLYKPDSLLSWLEPDDKTIDWASRGGWALDRKDW